MHFLITAGGTREYIDPVRFISNASSGRMGVALARAALSAGNKVTLIVANTTVALPKKARVVCVRTGGEMFKVVEKELAGCEVLIMAAAVCDYMPVDKSRAKIKKSNQPVTLKLKPTIDILRWAGQHKKRNQVLVGFALEDRELRVKAEAKLKEKRLDMIVANKPSAIGAERTSVQILIAGGKWLNLIEKSKTIIAKKIVTMAEKLLDDSFAVTGKNRLR